MAELRRYLPGELVVVEDQLPEEGQVAQQGADSSGEVGGGQSQGDHPAGVPAAAGHSWPVAVVAGRVPRSQQAGLTTGDRLFAEC